jgi:hypothetical protein
VPLTEQLLPEHVRAPNRDGLLLADAKAVISVDCLGQVRAEPVNVELLDEFRGATGEQLPHQLLVVAGRPPRAVVL